MGLLQGQERINTGNCLARVPSIPGCIALADHSGSRRQDGRKAAAEQETGVRDRINLGWGDRSEEVGGGVPIQCGCRELSGEKAEREQVLRERQRQSCNSAMLAAGDSEAWHRGRAPSKSSDLDGDRALICGWGTGD